jgi:hypothetical protein
MKCVPINRKKYRLDMKRIETVVEHAHENRHIYSKPNITTHAYFRIFRYSSQIPAETDKDDGRKVKVKQIA